MTFIPEDTLNLIEQRLMDNHQAEMKAFGRDSEKYMSSHSQTCDAIKHLRAKLTAAEARAEKAEKEKNAWRIKWATAILEEFLSAPEEEIDMFCFMYPELIEQLKVQMNKPRAALAQEQPQ